MTKEDRDRAQARADKVARAAQDARSGKAERDATAKAVLDNMAKLKALRLAREAAEPQRAPRAAGGGPELRLLRVSRHGRANARGAASRFWSGRDEKSVRYLPRYAGPGQSIIERVLFSAS